MSYVLKQNNEQIAISGGWNPSLFASKTNTSFRDVEPNHDWTWEHNGFWLGWIDDVIPEPVPPTIEELSENVRQALQNAIDIKARSFGFSEGNALMLYAGFSNPFQSLAQTFATWEASVWVDADVYKQQVIAGNQPMLTGEQAVALMPEYPT